MGTPEIPLELLFDDYDSAVDSWDLTEAKLPSSDVVKIYQNQIKDLPLVGSIEGRKLATFVQNGRYFGDVLEKLEFADVSIEPEVLHIKAATDAGKIASERLLMGHLRFGAYVARLTMGWVPYGSSEYNRNGESVFQGARIKNLGIFANAALPLADRIQAANHGLIQARSNFSPDKGAAFTTYAMWWIEQNIERAIGYDRNIKVPLNVLGALSRVIAHPHNLDGSTFPPITVIGLGSNDPPTQKRYIEEISTPLSLDDLQSESEAIAESLYIPGSDDELPPSFYETVYGKDNEELDLVETAHVNIRKAVVQKALEALPERDKRILELRFGFEGDPWTLESIGHEVDLTRERVRQLEGQALARLCANEELWGSIHGDRSRKMHEAARINTAVENRISNLEKRIYNLKLKAIKLKLGAIVINDQEVYQEELLSIATHNALFNCVKTMYETAPTDMYWLDMRRDESTPDLEKRIDVLIGAKASASYRRRVLQEFSKGLRTNLVAFVADKKVKEIGSLQYRKEFVLWLKQQAEYAHVQAVRFDKTQ